MKNLGYILLAFFLFSASLNAQNLGDLMNLAKDTFGASQEAGKEDADEASWEGIEKEIDKKIKDPKIKAMLSEFSEAFNKFSEESKTGKCLQLMGAYAEMLAYCDLMAETESDPCKRKDWYGIESMILFMGTSISYCPQEFYGISDFDDPDEETQRDIIAQYEAEINVYFFGGLLKNISHTINFVDFPTYFDNNLASSFGAKWNDFSVEEQQTFTSHLHSTMLELHAKLSYNEDPHFQLYYKFLNANEQLNLLGKYGKDDDDTNFIIDFVSKMFTPEYQIKKALEIASESSKIKCNN